MAWGGEGLLNCCQCCCVTEKSRPERGAAAQLKTVELAGAALALDGLLYRGQPLKIRRPSDFSSSLVPPGADLREVPSFDLAALGIVSPTVTDSPNTCFAGGLPPQLAAEQVAGGASVAIAWEPV